MQILLDQLSAVVVISVVLIISPLSWCDGLLLPYDLHGFTSAKRRPWPLPPPGLRLDDYSTFKYLALVIRSAYPCLVFTICIIVCTTVSINEKQLQITIMKSIILIVGKEQPTRQTNQTPREETKAVCLNIHWTSVDYTASHYFWKVTFIWPLHICICPAPSLRYKGCKGLCRHRYWQTFLVGGKWGLRRIICIILHIVFWEILVFPPLKLNSA